MGLFKFLKEKLSKKNNVDKYVTGLDKSRKNFADKLVALKARYSKIDDEYFEELEQILIMADVGVNTALDLVDATKEEAKLKGINDPGAINELLVDKMFISYASNETVSSTIQINDNELNIILVVGVNGVGKTTTIAKLTNMYKNKKVLLVAADTFRAGAVDQLEIWANRVGVDIVKGKENSDPSSVIFDGITKAKNDNYNIVICDTAGRIQTKQGLMDELAKLNRIIYKVVNKKANEVLLVIDATTGQNGILQAKAFMEACEVTGIILTKMDSTSKGGIVLAIKELLNIPVKYICFGEKIEDIEEFDLENYLYGLTKGVEE